MSCKLLRDYRTPITQGIKICVVSPLILLLAITHPLAQELEDGQLDPNTLYDAGDYRKALDIWMLSAFEGDPKSQFRVGVMFSEGKGVEQDFEQSAYWYTQAARQGHIAAQYNLGHIYMTGAGIRQDDAEALKWWKSAAEGGHDLAQYNIGRAHYMGIGGDKDPEAAHFWFSQAAANGEPRSQEILERLGWEALAAVHVSQPLISDDPDPVAPTLEESVLAGHDRPHEPLPETQNVGVATGDGDAGNGDKVASVSGILTKFTDGEPSLGSPVGAPLEDRPPLGPEILASIVPDQAPPQEIVTSSINWTPRPDPTSVSLSNPVGSPLEEQAPVAPEMTPTTDASVSPTISELAPSEPPAQASAGASTPEQPLLIVQARENIDQPTQEPGTGKTSTTNDEPASPDEDLITVYASPGTDSLLLGIVKVSANWRIIDRSGSWLRVTRTPGFPVWVHSSQVSVAAGYVTVVGDRVNIRAVPVVDRSSIIATARQGQRLKVVSNQGDWIRVLSPTNTAAWVKEEELNPRAIAATAPGRNSSPGWRTVGEKQQARTHVKDDEGWLFTQPPSWFTIQIISLANEQGILDFIGNLGLDEAVHYFTSIVDKRLWYSLRYGSFPTYEAARSASMELPVAGQTIWVRNFGVLRRDRCESRENLPDKVGSELLKWCSEQG
jgi:SH3-like domain-containing protein